MRNEDIDSIDAEYQPLLGALKSAATVELPPGSGDVAQQVLSGVEMNTELLDLPEQQLALILVTGTCVSSSKVRYNILSTDVGEMVIHASATTWELSFPQPSIDRGCPACDNTLDRNPDRCHACGWESDNPINPDSPETAAF